MSHLTHVGKYPILDVTLVQSVNDLDALVPCKGVSPDSGAMCTLPIAHEGAHRGQVLAFLTLEMWSTPAPTIKRRVITDSPQA